MKMHLTPNYLNAIANRMFHFDVEMVNATAYLDIKRILASQAQNQSMECIPLVNLH